MDDSDQKATASQKLAHFTDKKDIVKALDTTNAELLYLGTLRNQLNVRPNSGDPTESALATKALAVIYAYVEESPDCTQLFKIWEWQQQNAVTKIEVLIVEVLSKLIHQCNTALHRLNAMKITRTILQNHLTVVYRHLSSGRQNTVQATLRLLTAMNHVHHQTTKEIKDEFNFGLKALSKLRHHRRPKEGETVEAAKVDTRTLYVQFLMAFFVRGDATVKKEMLEIPDLVQKTLNDLHLDSPQLIKQTLSVLLNNIVMDSALSRSVKISFFSTSFLVNLLRLYNRTEPEGHSDQTVAEIAHKFFMALCTTPGVGVCFQDAAWYPASMLNANSSVEKSSGDNSKQVFNKTLSQLITHLRPTEHILQQELTVAILAACPELVRHFWQRANVQMEPRLSARWLANMTLLHKITEIPVPNLYLQHTGLFASHPPPVSTIIENIIPSTANRSILSRGLQHSSMLVRYITIVELAAAFQKTEQVIAVMQSAVRTLANDEEESISANDTMDLEGSGVQTKQSDPPAQQWATAISLLLAELRRRVPDIGIIISLHNGIQSLSVTEVSDEERIRLNLFNNGILRLIKYYQKFLPQAVSESKFDIGKLIPSDFSTVQAGTLIHLLELLLELNDFRWSNKAADGTSSHLTKLFSLFLTTAHPHIKSLTRRLLTKLLGESILFHHDPSEANLWIEAIPSTNYGQPDMNVDQMAFLQFLDDCAARCLRTPYKYVDQSSKIAKTVQERIVAAEQEPTSKTPQDKLAQILATSAHQNISQQYSPLLMTVLEQFQHVYGRETVSKDVSRYITLFLHRLIPSLSWNQNRSQAFAIECMQRIQDPTAQDIENVLKMNATQRKLATIGVTESLAMTLQNLEHRDVPVGKENKKSTVDSTQLLSLLNEEDRSAFVQGLQGQSAASVASNFVKVVEYALKSRVTEECLVDFVQTHFPFAGSIYSVPDVSALLAMESMDSEEEEGGQQANIIHTFLKAVPFPALFENATSSSVSDPFVLALLRTVARDSAPRHLALYSTLIIQRLAKWVQSNVATTKTVDACFSLLSTLLECSRVEEAVFTHLKTQVFENFNLRELYLYGSSDKKSSFKQLDSVDVCIVDLLVSATKTTSTKSNSRTVTADSIIAAHYVRKTVEQVMHELESMKKSGAEALQAKTVQYFSKIATMCHVSDLTMLLQTLLGIHRHAKFSTTTAFNSLLSTILRHLTQQGGSVSAIPTDSTAALLDLWREQPSDELDSIVLDVVRGRLWPNAMAGTVQPLDLTSPGVFDRALDALQGSSHFDDVDISLVDFIMKHLNTKRSLILAALLTSSSAFRERFMTLVKKLSEEDLESRMEDSDFTTLLHAYMSRITHRTEHAFQWSESATKDDRHSLADQQSRLLPKLIQRVAETTYSSQESIRMAEIASMILALTTSIEDEDAVESDWNLLESIPRVGLDTIQILETLLETTKEIPEEKQMERQDKLAIWFEEAARRLIVVLDKNGDAEWLEPVCDRLYTVVEDHVLDRKMNIDQKVLFELVSFAIEKALDNVQLVRFCACLAKKYYVETSQGSILPQILQTLFKHKQFSSLVMATAPTTKYAVPENMASRLAIVQLIYTLTSLEPETCCKAGFVPMLLSCYAASTCVADQLVLSVLRITESQTAGSISNRAPIWGSGAENTKSSGALFGQTMINESLDLLDPSMMMATLIHFPVDRELEYTAPEVSLEDYSDDVLKSRAAPVYDPCFLLPLFGTYMAFGNLLDCRRLIEVNGLGLIIVALSSTDENMRLAAFSLLDDFYNILSHATMREKNQLLLLLDSLKNSITDRGTDEDDAMTAPRIPAVVTTFVAHALSALLRPDHFMYPHVNKFCLQRPTIDLEDIPMFYSLFNSSSEQHRKERVWMLRLLAASLKTSDDYKMFRRRHVVDLLVAFFNSQLSEPLSKKIVIEILFNAVAIPKVALQLITQSAFLSWLHTLTAINTMSSENEFSLVPARLLLRVIQSCPKESIRWMNGIWRNQVAGIATSLLRQLSLASVNTGNLNWTLACLESILEVFAYLDFSKKSDEQQQQQQQHQSSSSSSVSANSNLQHNSLTYFTSLHTGILVQLLFNCEQVMTVTYDQRPVPIPVHRSFQQGRKGQNIPSRSDPLDLLYKIDPVPVKSHSRVVRLGLDLMASHSQLPVDQQDVVLSRALCYRVDRASELARLRADIIA
ncbi:hypothetical protein BGZ83_005861 [Gryganskiella cystojenkinii]|nr:hypothetical protein BGZ83_005861 [Gryganskiella cystojenkinii]